MYYFNHIDSGLVLESINLFSNIAICNFLEIFLAMLFKGYKIIRYFGRQGML